MSDYQSADLQERVRIKGAEHDGPAAPEKQRVPGHPVVELQRHLGNAHVARMIAQRAGPEEEAIQAKHDTSVQRAGEEDELQAKHDTSVQRAGEEDELQAKHDTSVQRAGAEEKELQAKHDTSVQRAGEEDELQAKHDTSVQRADAEEEEDAMMAKHDTSVQRESEQVIGLEGGAVGSSMSSAINSARGGGSALAEGVRSAAESTMGADFSGVRVHQDSQSDQLNRSMTAKAFTTGSDIFLRGDQNSSDTSLMAHELTHVVQQSSGSVSSGGGMTVGAADDSHEHEADAVAQQVVAGGPQRKQEESPAG